MNTVFLVTISILGLAMARRGGRQGLGACSDGSMPTCPDGAMPGHVKGQGMIKAACSDGSRPRTCPDGSMPARSSTGGVGGGRGDCAVMVASLHMMGTEIPSLVLGAGLSVI